MSIGNTRIELAKIDCRVRKGVQSRRMGFIEDLKGEMAARTEAQRVANQLADQRKERERIADLARAEEQRDGKERATKIIEENLRKTKEQVEQTGLKQVIQEMIDIKAARELKEEFREEGFRVGLGGYVVCTHTYKAKLTIGSFDSGNYEYTKRIGINVSSDGTVTFEGSKKAIFSNEKVPFKISIGKDKWHGNRRVLEEGLEKVYRNPLVERGDISQSYKSYLDGLRYDQPPGGGG